MLKTVTVAFCLAATVALGGCATQRENRILSDSAIGAGGGALLGAVAGFNPLVGAAIGGAGGAAVGAATH
jgi:osmotically inducible lipoprotein OsmB